MILVDTNIVSVLLAPSHPDSEFIETWWRTCPDQDFCMSAISRAEIAYGVAILPEDSKRRSLSAAANSFFTLTAERWLAFGMAEADAYGQIVAARRAQGHPISVLDAQIAATARVAGATVATRNITDFRDCGVPLLNPYER